MICYLLRELSVLIGGRKNPNQVLVVGRRTLLIVKLQTVIHPVTTNVYRVVPDEVTESFPVSQQTTPLVDSSSHHNEESDYSDNQNELPVNSDQQVTSNDIEELNSEEIDEEQNTEIVSELSSTENTHLNSDENIDNELQNPPRYPKRNRRQP